MQLIWELGECTVGEIRTAIEAQKGIKPPHSTVSALVLALDKKGFLAHKAYGRTFVYRPTISREEYGRQSLGSLIQRFFGGSPNRLMAHLAREENLSLEEIDQLMRQLEEE